MLGQSFAPLGDQDPLRRNQPGDAANPVQEAIKVLSLRMPRVMGAGAPAPPQLLMSMGSAGMSGSGNPLAAFIQQMLMPGAPQGGGMSAGGGAAPPPPVLPLPNIDIKEPGAEDPPGPPAPVLGGRTPSENAQHTGTATNRPGGPGPFGTGGRQRPRY